MVKTMGNNKHAKSSWKSTSQSKSKPWGHEILWAGHASIHGKILHIKAGQRTSLKYHRLKSESLYFLRGEAKVTFGDQHSLKDPIAHPLQTAFFKAGDALMVQSECPYRIEALEDCEVIEIGNHLEDAFVRIEDDYGRMGRHNRETE